AQHVPRLERLAKLKCQTTHCKIARERKAKFEMGRKPFSFQWIASLAKINDNIFKVLPDKMRKHPAIVDVCSPSHERPLIRLLPECGDRGSQQEMLSQTHSRVRRHFEGAHLQ